MSTIATKTKAGAKGQRNIQSVFRRLASLESASGLAEAREEEVITMGLNAFVEHDAWVVAGLVDSVPDPLVAGEGTPSKSSLVIAGMVAAIGRMGYEVAGFGVSPSRQVWALRIPFGEHIDRSEVSPIQSRLDRVLTGIYHEVS